MIGTRIGWSAALIGLAVAATLVSACSSPSGTGSALPTDGGGLVNALCGRCHPVGRVAGAHHDRAGWTATIARMRSHGVKLTDQQAQTIVDYLTKRDGGS